VRNRNTQNRLRWELSDSPEQFYHLRSNARAIVLYSSKDYMDALCRTGQEMHINRNSLPHLTFAQLFAVQSIALGLQLSRTDILRIQHH
jgi:hypothetical protein